MSRPEACGLRHLAFQVTDLDTAVKHLNDHGVAVRSRRYKPGAAIFTQGAQADSVFFIQDGGVKLSVLSSSGKEAVVAMLGAGDFCGEGCLAGPQRGARQRELSRPAEVRAAGQVERAVNDGLEDRVLDGAEVAQHRAGLHAQGWAPALERRAAADEGRDPPPWCPLPERLTLLTRPTTPRR